MKRTILALLPLIILAGCDSSATLVARTTTPIPSLEAKFVPSTTGGSGMMGIDVLPQELQEAKTIQVVFGTIASPLTKTPTGKYTAMVPATARLNRDVEGRLPLLFVLDLQRSQIIDVKLTPAASL